MPTITALLSVHNGLPHLPHSVASILAQDFADFEFLILDDASTDGTREYLRSIRDPRIRLIELSQNIGLTAALNLGIREARGIFIARQDADDLSDSARFRLQLSALQTNSRIDLIGSQARLINEAGRSMGNKDFPNSHPGIRLAHLWDNALAHTAVMMRRSALEPRAYDEAWSASQDYELWSRLSETHRLANLPQRLVTLRVCAGSITRNHRKPALIRAVQAAHFYRLTGRAATEHELNVIGAFRGFIPAEQISNFDALLRLTSQAIVKAHPGCECEDDFRRTLAMIRARVGYNLITQNRRTAFGQIGKALHEWPPALLTLPWARILALALVGERIRTFYERSIR